MVGIRMYDYEFDFDHSLLVDAGKGQCRTDAE